MRWPLHRKGDLVSVAGNMQLDQWTDKDGATQQGYQVIADSVLSAGMILYVITASRRTK